jgi:hypothetical protein
VARPNVSKVTTAPAGHLLERWLPGVPDSASAPFIRTGVFGSLGPVVPFIAERDDQFGLGREGQDQTPIEELIYVRKLASGESGHTILVARRAIGYLAGGISNAGVGFDAEVVVGPSEFGVVGYEADRVKALADEVGERVGFFPALWRVELAEGHVGE